MEEQTKLITLENLQQYHDIAYDELPVALPNPEALTLQLNGSDLDTYDGSQAKTINIELPAGDIPDWNINDPENSAYIKNRTHYSETETVNIYDKSSVQMYLSPGANGVNWYTLQISTTSTGVDFSKVDNINLTLGGTEYANIPKNSVTVNDNGVLIEVYYFGNQLAMSSFSPYVGAIDTGEEYSVLVDSNVLILCLRTENTSGYAFASVKLDAVISEIVHKLPNKYLDIINDSAPNTDSVYSSFKISEMFSSLNSEYVRTEDNSINITWDGDTTDRVGTDPVGLYKVSDAQYYSEDILGSTITLSDGYSMKVTDFIETSSAIDVIDVNGSRVTILRQGNYKDKENNTYTEAGIYFSNKNSIYVKSLIKDDIQEIDGAKKFNNSVIVNEPTEDGNPATKKYVDDLFALYQQSLIEQLSKLTTPQNTTEELSSSVDLEGGVNNG